MEESYRENNKDHISQSRGSALDGGGHMNSARQSIHGALNKRREWRIALGNHYAWLQTRWWMNQTGK